MKIREVEAGDVAALTLTGDLDQEAAEEIRTKVLPLLIEQDRVLLDFTGVGSVTEVGLRAMLLLHRYAKHVGARIALVGVSSEISDVLDAAGFLHFFVLAPDRATAVAELGGRVLEGRGA
jgi:anti-anti-sigma factor